MCIVLGGFVPKGGVRSVVVVFGILVLLRVRVVVSRLRLVFGDVGATGEASGLTFAVGFKVWGFMV